MKKNLKIATLVFLFVSILGLLDATYLTIEHYSGNIPPCTIGGCEVVLTSAQSKIVGFPVSLLGVFYYATILILALVYLQTKQRSVIKLLSYLTICGMLASAYFVYLQFFVIKQICQYCMLSATTSTLLFATGVYVIQHSKKYPVLAEN